MAKILAFKLPEKADPAESAPHAVVSSSVDDVMLIIHHALHGTDKDSQPKDHQLAAQLLDELSMHIKANREEEPLVLDQFVSQEIFNRYPEAYQKQTRKGGG